MLFPDAGVQSIILFEKFRFTDIAEFVVYWKQIWSWNIYGFIEAYFSYFVNVIVSFQVVYVGICVV